MSDFTTLRERMVDRQIAARGLDDPALLAAFRAVPREEFISGDYADYAYADAPLPIESGQTISQPYIVALTIDAARIGGQDKVLEIGAGMGNLSRHLAPRRKRYIASDIDEEHLARLRVRLRHRPNLEVRDQ